MSKDKDVLAQMLAQILGQSLDPVEIIRVEYSEKGYAFVAYGANGEAFPGGMGDKSLTQEVIKERLVADATSGGLGQYFARYNPVEADELTELRAANDDWADIYVAQA